MWQTNASTNTNTKFLNPICVCVCATMRGIYVEPAQKSPGSLSKQEEWNEGEREIESECDCECERDRWRLQMNKFTVSHTLVPIDIIITIGRIPCIVIEAESSLIETEIYAWPAPGRTHPLTELSSA